MEKFIPLCNQDAKSEENFLLWQEGSYGNRHGSFLATTSDASGLDRWNTIKENKTYINTDTRVEINVSFEKNTRDLSQVIMFLEEKDNEGQWRLTRNCLGLDKRTVNGEVIGHDLLSDAEFEEVVSKARDAFDACYDKLNWVECY